MCVRRDGTTVTARGVMTASDNAPISLAAVGRSALILTGGAAMVQLIGFFRQLFMAAEVGITSELDAFLIGMAAPLAAAGVLVAGVQVALVPAYAAVKSERGEAEARHLVGTVLIWTFLASLVLSVVLWVFADPIVAITGPGLAESGMTDEAVRYLRLLTPLTSLGAVSAIFFALCQAETMFIALAVSSVSGPLLTLLIMVYYWDSLGLDGMVVGSIVGAVLSLAVVVVASIRGHVAPKPRWLARGLGMPSLLRHAGPLTLSSVILQINLIADRALASMLAAGGVSALAFGESLVKVPFGAIRPAWNTALYPALVRADRSSQPGGLGTTTERLLQYALAFFVPLAALTAAVAPVATAVAYDRGAFSQADLTLTAHVVAVSAPLIVLWTIAPTLVSALNARRRGDILLWASVLNVVVNVAFDIVLGFLFGVVGIALATTAVSVVMVVYLGRKLAQEDPALSLSRLMGTFWKALLAILPSAILFGIPIWLGDLDGDLFARLAILFVVGVAGLASYVVVAGRIGLAEPAIIVGFGRDTLRRIRARATVWHGR
jgi:putative peptidoglycan lipid II flippase